MSVWRNLLMSILTEPKCFFSASVCLLGSICVCLNWSPMFLFANICLKGPVGVYLDHPNISFCKCLSDWFDRCLSELVPTVSFLPMSVWRDLLMSIWTEPNISFCKCLSDWCDRCLSELDPTVSFCQCLSGGTC